MGNRLKLIDTVIDGGILLDFFTKRPELPPFGEPEDVDLWNSFWRFLQKKTNLDVRNYDKDNRFHKQFFTQLTTGCGNSDIVIPDESPIHKKGKLLSEKLGSFYCIDESDEEYRSKLENENGCVVAFKDNYKKYWEQLILFHLPKTLSVTKDTYLKEYNFESWDLLNNYLTKFTDVVIVDNYIFSWDNDIIAENFQRILINLNKATPVKFNLTIYTYERGLNPRFINQDKEVIIEKVNEENAENIIELVERIIKDCGINCSVKLIFADAEVKEHDRGIFTNYLRIKSGHSFNYFYYLKLIVGEERRIRLMTRKKIKITDTEIDFFPLVYPNNRGVAAKTLTRINRSIKDIEHRKPESVYGNCENNLLTQFDEKTLIFKR